MTKSVIALHKNVGWKHVQLDGVTKLQKTWEYESEEYRVDAFFGTLRNGNATPVVIMNTYKQGAGVKEVIDDNCDIWKNIFITTNKNEGNEFFKYLKKHGFKKA